MVTAHCSASCPAVRRPRLPLGALLLLLALAGCGKLYWSRPGAGFDEFSQDSAACAREHAMFSTADRTRGVVDIEPYRTCLRARGWTRAQHVEPVPPGWFRGFERDRVVQLDVPPPQPGTTVVEQGPAPADAAGGRDRSPSAVDTLAHELDALDRLRARGAISDAEHATRRQHLLARALTSGSTGTAETARAALLGTWNGELHVLAGSLRELGTAISAQADPWVVRLTIVTAGAGYRWALSGSRAGNALRAEGPVQIVGGRVKLIGGFDGRSGSLSGVRVEYTIAVDDNTLTVSGTSTDNRVHRLSFRKASP